MGTNEDACVIEIDNLSINTVDLRDPLVNTYFLGQLAPQDHGWAGLVFFQSLKI